MTYWLPAKAATGHSLVVVEMRYKDAFMIAGQIIDMLANDDPAMVPTMRQQEKMANIIEKHADLLWDDHNQEWRDPETYRPAFPAGGRQ